MEAYKILDMIKIVLGLFIVIVFIAGIKSNIQKEDIAEKLMSEKYNVSEDYINCYNIIKDNFYCKILNKYGNIEHKEEVIVTDKMLDKYKRGEYNGSN